MIFYALGFICLVAANYGDEWSPKRHLRDSYADSYKIPHNYNPPRSLHEENYVEQPYADHHDVHEGNYAEQRYADHHDVEHPYVEDDDNILACIHRCCDTVYGRECYFSDRGHLCKKYCHERYGYKNDIDDDKDTIQLTNDSDENPLNIYMAYENPALEMPTNKWSLISGNCIIGDPTKYGPDGTEPANDVGAGTWQVIQLAAHATCSVKIPDFKEYQPWSIRPLKYIDGKACSGQAGCGMPILIEGAKDIIADMSAVDGVNFLLKYTLTTHANPGTSTIDFKTNPCKAIGANPVGCKNPSVDGEFKPGKAWPSEPCTAGTCNLIGPSLTWCDAIHTGQCANSTSEWNDHMGGADTCRPLNLYTTYCYSHDDANSSPTFAPPYNMQLVYRNLDSHATVWLNPYETFLD